MDVELRHLRCLIAIVDTGGFTDAAHELGISQPAVSRTLAALENVLGVRLLRRTSRQVVLTAAGERVLARGRRVLAEIDDLAREARGGAGRLRIGHAWATMGAHTVEFQRRWAHRYPDVTLQFVRTNTPSGGLAEGACDISAEPEVKLWDLAALQIILTEAGGRFTSLEGEATPGGGSVVCTNGHLHDEVLGRLRNSQP